MTTLKFSQQHESEYSCFVTLTVLPTAQSTALAGWKKDGGKTHSVAETHTHVGLGWPKSLFSFFQKVTWENTDKLFSQPSPCRQSIALKEQLKRDHTLVVVAFYAFFLPPNCDFI